ncbi:helicase C-terminal domain-containing protein [Entophlyctis helioformis]|nr:helicase C-terminal domain-containing protein [Entophlyctis helioformis]
MIGMIIKAINESKNALLESPTGTGKTLTILSAVFAWQEAEKARILEAKLAFDMAAAQPPQAPEACDPPKPTSSINLDAFKYKEPKRAPAAASSELLYDAIEDDDDDFQGSVRIHHRKPTEAKASRHQPAASSSMAASSDSIGASHAAHANSVPVLPKIYIASRTQKQIQQMVNELRNKMPYRPRMAILGSREHYCINTRVRKQTDKNEACVAELEANSCSFHQRSRDMSSQSLIPSGDRHAVWDIEDLVTAGKKAHRCPYYASRSMAASAQVVFAPYNYILDPQIRASSEVVLKGNILVIDEAHNIENTCMEAGSLELSEASLTDSHGELSRFANPKIRSKKRPSKKIGDDGPVDETEEEEYYEEELQIHTMLKEHYRTLAFMLKIFVTFLEGNRHGFTIHEFDRSLRVWAGADIVSTLAQMGIQPGSVSLYAQALKSIETVYRNREKNDKKDKNTPITLSRRSRHVVSGLIMVLQLILSETYDHAKDYRLVLIKKQNLHQTLPIAGPDWLYSISFWCLNPAVIFRDIASQARAVVLVSGTLSPLNSFSSELATQFAYTIEAPHVIHDDQVCIGALPTGANGLPLLATYKHVETFEFQDQLGLCLTDGQARQTMVADWSVQDFQQTKRLFSEPRTVKASGKNSLEQIMADYDAACRQGTGAALMCVYRGKMSEGIDFADHRARGVICVGLPYPNLMETRVKEKRDYNSTWGSRAGLLNGNEWYEIQAFRALNQALGRCIRHRNDWGSIILLDQRFAFSKSISSLSKWIRTRTKPWSNLHDAETKLKEFFEYRASPACQETARKRDEERAIKARIEHQKAVRAKHERLEQERVQRLKRETLEAEKQRLLKEQQQLAERQRQLDRDREEAQNREQQQQQQQQQQQRDDDSSSALFQVDVDSIVEHMFDDQMAQPLASGSNEKHFQLEHQPHAPAVMSHAAADITESSRPTTATVQVARSSSAHLADIQDGEATSPVRHVLQTSTIAAMSAAQQPVLAEPTSLAAPSQPSSVNSSSGSSGGIKRKPSINLSRFAVTGNDQPRLSPPRVQLDRSLTRQPSPTLPPGQAIHAATGIHRAASRELDEFDDLEMPSWPDEHELQHLEREYQKQAAQQQQHGQPLAAAAAAEATDAFMQGSDELGWLSNPDNLNLFHDQDDSQEIA